jgi:hypothetical protein
LIVLNYLICIRYVIIFSLVYLITFSFFSINFTQVIFYFFLSFIFYSAAVISEILIKKLRICTNRNIFPLTLYLTLDGIFEYFFQNIDSAVGVQNLLFYQLYLLTHWNRILSSYSLNGFHSL